ncbi:MAG: YjfB family protein [Lachnospiraceae bacterium]|jgi:hypothetical protein|nr:YjfB family protein [Lachnospiraceae bacterium]
MNIAAASINLSSIDTNSRIGVAMLAKSLDMLEDNGAAMIEMMNDSMELSVNPLIGANVDLIV